MSDRLCLLSVHAHPDDEASKGAGTVARYAAEGVRTVLVCCTGGEAGDILNPAMDREDVRSRLHEVRMDELRTAADIIGYEELCLLGYRDSGMPDSPHNDDPMCFAKADLVEAVGLLVAIIRSEQPHVLITYGDDQKSYPHPDHLQVHSVSIAAFDAAGDPARYPEAGPAWQPLKMYYSAWSRERARARHEKFLELGLESPYKPEWFDRDWQDHRITTKIDLTGFEDISQRALLAHATQVDPNSPFWFGLPEDVARTIYPHDDYILARSLVEVHPPETDLFAGVRDQVGASERQ
ncbi:MAG TPA: mycothiol conjugate amidase Mca [Actinomycetota bacterium]|nr:mycothiol conjugate amidase Mca [Actinomycetota bacterium]